jgi:dihydroneopterin aldolase
MPQERIIGAMFYVTLHIDLEVKDEAILDDNLAGTVSYADIVQSVREEMSVSSALLEHLAYRVGHKLITDFSSIKSLSIRIDKENPPCGANVAAIGVSMNLCR